MTALAPELHEALSSCAKQLGAQRAYLVCAHSSRELLVKLKLVDAANGASVFGVELLSILGEAGLEVANLPALKEAAQKAAQEAAQKAAHKPTTLLVCDITPLSFAMCPACRLGAHLSYEELSEGFYLLGISAETNAVMPELSERLEAMQSSVSLDGETISELAEALAKRGEQCRKKSDNAAVVARYLSCHPQVDWCAYPGLMDHPSRSIADKIITGGFGPYVDFTIRPYELDRYAQVVCQSGSLGSVVQSDAARLELRESELGSIHARERHYFRYTAGLGSAKSDVLQLESALTNL